MMCDKSAEEIQCDIEMVLHEGMNNIVLVCLSENLKPVFTYEALPCEEPNCALWRVTAKATYIGRPFTIVADMPVRFPDEAVGGIRIDNTVFSVEIDDYGAAFNFLAWCEYNPYNGAVAIVHQSSKTQNYERWLVGHSFESEVLYRGEWEDLMPWAKDIVRGQGLPTEPLLIGSKKLLPHHPN